jgi:hypothetical protein
MPPVPESGSRVTQHPCIRARELAWPEGMGLVGPGRVVSGFIGGHIGVMTHETCVRCVVHGTVPAARPQRRTLLQTYFKPTVRT